MIRSPENLVKVLDCLTVNPSPTAAARAIGASNKIVWIWGTQSAAKAAEGVPIEESGFGVRWPDPDGPLVWFHEAFQQATKIFLALASMEHMALIGPDAGHKKVARDGSGKITFKVDLKVASDAMQMDDFTWELIYGTRPKTDIFARDEDGCLIPDVYTEPLPAQLRIHLLRSLLPSQFNPEQRSTSDVHHHGGVLMIGEHKPRSALRDDLESRLARIRAAKDGERVTRPSGPVEVFGRGDGGPTERVNNAAGDDASRPLNEHPRAYQAPAALPPPEKPVPDYSRRPTKNLDASDRKGMPPGGFSQTTGRPT
ncbi:MAG TPA: hypothetical protein VL048_05860 [Xanthobacteraceae bacterium]|nr:hypothetical protein [Xanthobacteraceae bacterium]